MKGFALWSTAINWFENHYGNKNSLPVVQGREEEILIIYGQFNPKYLIFPHLFTAQQACCFYCCNDFTLIYCCTSYYKTLPAGLGVSKQEKKGNYSNKNKCKSLALAHKTNYFNNVHVCVSIKIINCVMNSVWWWYSTNYALMPLNKLDSISEILCV